MSENNGQDDPKKLRYVEGMKRGYKFTLRIAERCYLLQQKDLTEQEICWVLNIPERTFTTWKKHDFFRLRLEKAKQLSERKSEAQLQKRANGMIVTDVQITETTGGVKVTVNEKGEVIKEEPMVKTIRTVTKRELPPDFQSLRFKMINRHPERWADKPTTLIQDNRSYTQINVNAEEVVSELNDKYGERSKQLSDAVIKILGIPVEEIPPDTKT